MTTYNGNIGNLLQGVSQQPRRDRRPEQVQVQENCYSSVTSGTGNRPGTEVGSADIAITGFPTAKKHTYDRGSGNERYTLVGGDGTLDVVDLITGLKKTVNGDTSYLADASGENKDPEDYLRFFTIADTTFAVNATKTVQMDTLTGDPGWQCCLYLAAAKYGRDYKVFADGGQIASVTTPSTVSLDPTAEIDKTIGLKSSDTMLTLAEGSGAAVASAPVQVAVKGYSKRWVIKKSILDASGFVAGNTVSFSNGMPGTPETEYKLKSWTGSPWEDDEYVLSIYDLTETDFIYCQSHVNAVMTQRPLPAAPIVAGSIREWADDEGVSMYTTQDASVVVLQSDTPHVIEVSDDSNGDDLRVIGTTFAQYEKLPAQCLHGYKVKILGEDAEKANDYYVQFERDDNGTGVGRGIWRECAGFSEPIGFDASTMPHKIISEADGTFTIAEIEWDDKAAGDQDSNPSPSFVDSTITSMGLYQNRFAFLTGENCVASRTFEHFNMFSESVIVTSDDDPIDTASSDNKITDLEHMLIFNSSLFILSDKAQFIHPGDTAFTANTFSLASKSQYSTDTTAAPVASATSVFFANRYGEFSGLREFRIDPLTGVVAAESITTHVKEYIPGTVKQIVSSVDHNIILVRTDADASDVYVYEWFDQDNTRKQAAWHVWKFSADIHHLDIVQDTLYLWHTHDANTVRFTTIDLADRNSTSLAFPLRLDLRQMTQATSDGDYWSVDRALSTLHGTWDDVVVTGGLNSGIEGAKATWSPKGDDTGVLIPKEAVPNPTGTPWFYVGRKYDAKITLTNPFVRDSQGTPKTTSKTTLKFMKFNLSTTGYLKATIEKENAPTFVMEYDSQIIGSSAFNLNSAAPLQDASLRVPIRSDANRCSVTLSSDSHLPFHILDVDWSGTYKERGRRTI